MLAKTLMQKSFFGVLLMCGKDFAKRTPKITDVGFSTFYFNVRHIGTRFLYTWCSNNSPQHIKWTFTGMSVNNLINWKSIYLNTEFCPSLHCLSLTDGVVGAYVQFDLNQTLSQFLHWHEISASQIHTLAVRNSSGEGATLWKNDEGQNLERHSRKSTKNFSLSHFTCVQDFFPHLLVCVFFLCWEAEILHTVCLPEMGISPQTNTHYFSQLPQWPPLSLNGVW